MDIDGSLSKNLNIKKVEIKDVSDILNEHIESLSYPMDSWMEDRLVESTKYQLMYGEICIAYIGILKDILHFFYVKKAYFKYAPAILEKVIKEKAIGRVFIMTQDSLLTALLAEWDYDIEKKACWFTDNGIVEDLTTKVENAIFRVATLLDLQNIKDISGDFFFEASGGFTCLEERIEAETIFLLEDRTILLGCGIIEKSRFCNNLTSIGMFVNREHRRKGVAKKILLNLKAWSYLNMCKPVAGCWFYNTLSRKSLESAGMVATAIGYEAVLKGKEILPIRTGNPPGELVE